MFELLMIVILAVWALWMSNSERKRPAVLIVMGLMSVALGGRVVAQMSDSYSQEYLGAVYADEQAPEAEMPPRAEQDDLGNVGQDATPVSSSRGPRQLSLEPTPSFRYLTTPRPDWVETDVLKSEDGYQIAVESGLHVRKRTAQQALRDNVKAAIDSYVNDYLESELASTLTGYAIEEGDSSGTRTVSLRLEGQTFDLARERFDEQVEFDYGVMHQSHALVKIDQDIRQALDQRWGQVRATSRLFQTALGAGALLLLLGTMLSYLKLDTATRGYYTGRLQFGAAAAILAIVAAGVVCANWIPWM
ncbi:MAG: hypothetical protein WD070_09600 [Pirellulaceae bacterium]